MTDGASSSSYVPTFSSKCVAGGTFFETKITADPRVEIVSTRSCKCENHRQRYPEIEAILQLFFRICGFVLSVATLIIVRVLDQGIGAAIVAKYIYFNIGYCILLHTIEFISLSNPHSPTLDKVFPKHKHCRLDTGPRFLRLPSIYLAIFELAAIIVSFNNAVLFLNPEFHNSNVRGDCDPVTCVTSEEHCMIIGYMLEVVMGLIHCGFFAMACVHFLKRKGAEWFK